MDKKTKITLFYGFILPFLLGALSGSYGKHLIRKEESRTE